MEDKQYKPSQAIQTITSNINFAFDGTISTRLTKRQASLDVLSLAEAMSVFCTTPWSLLTPQPRTRRPELETFVPSQLRLPHLLPYACWCQHIPHRTPLKVTAFGGRKPSFQFWPCHDLWLWTSSLTSLQLTSLTSEIRVKSSHEAWVRLTETSEKS